jgi:hypothetical protein
MKRSVANEKRTARASNLALDPICGRCGAPDHDERAPHCAFCGTILGRATHPDTAEQCEGRFNTALAVAIGPTVVSMVPSLAGPTSAPAAPVLIKVGEAARLLDMKTDALYQAVNRGQVPGVVRTGRTGRGLRFHRERLLAGLDKKASR